MGMMMFTESGTFNPSEHGLNIGDYIDVICVGAGASGASNALRRNISANTYDTVSVASNPGGATSFGTHLSAAGGAASGMQAYSMGDGGKGSYAKWDAAASNYNSYGLPGGGAGGFEPGIPIIGGKGGDGTGLAAMTTYPTYKVTLFTQNPSGLGGKGGLYVYSGHSYDILPMETPYGNVSGSGSRGSGYAGDAGSLPAGGHGYGAGGSGGTCSWSTGVYAQGGKGGVAGSYRQLAIKLTSLSAIPVTVGTGGAATQKPADDSQYSFSSSPSGKGANGVCIVFW